MNQKRIRAAVFILRDETIALMHRVKDGEEYYVLPGGGVKNGETIEQAAIREVWEEMSLNIRLEKLLYQLIVDDTSEHYYFLAHYESGDIALGDCEEVRERLGPTNIYSPQWFQLAELPHLLVYPLEVRDRFLQDLETGLAKSEQDIRLTNQSENEKSSCTPSPDIFEKERAYGCTRRRNGTKPLK